jgi:hypothetical protein
MLFVSSSGLENAKKAITAYKKGDVKEMSPELWRAKQIVDSTLHPGTSFVLQGYTDIANVVHRHRRASVSPIPNVQLRPLEPRRHGRHAYTGIEGMI